MKVRNTYLGGSYYTNPSVHATRQIRFSTYATLFSHTCLKQLRRENRLFRINKTYPSTVIVSLDFTLTFFIGDSLSLKDVSHLANSSTYLLLRHLFFLRRLGRPPHVHTAHSRCEPNDYLCSVTGRGFHEILQSS